MDYRYRNREAAATILWVALPLRRAGQEAVRIALTAGEPEAAWLADVNGGMTEVALEHLDAACNAPSSETLNALVRYRVRAGETIAFTALARTRAVRLVDDATALRLGNAGWATTDGVGHLSDAARSYFTRSSRLVPIDDAVRTEAQRILAAEPDPLPGAPPEAVVAQRLASHLRGGEYRYQWPPAAAGTTAMRQTRAGDCASFALLLVSWCRSLGIPARAVVGSWARATMEGHVWSEVFVSDVGWAPLDPCAGVLVQRRRGEFVPQLDAPHGFDPHDPASFDSGVERGRLAFSVDVEAHSLPGFTAWTPVPAGTASVPMADVPLHWGFELLDGRVPYLQPAYPRFSVPAPATSDAALLGTWSFRAPPNVRGANWLAALALGSAVTSAVALLAELPLPLPENAGHSLLGSLALLLVARMAAVGPSVERSGAALLLSASFVVRCAQ